MGLSYLSAGRNVKQRFLPKGRRSRSRRNAQPRRDRFPSCISVGSPASRCSWVSRSARSRCDRYSRARLQGTVIAAGDPAPSPKPETRNPAPCSKPPSPSITRCWRYSHSLVWTFPTTGWPSNRCRASTIRPGSWGTWPIRPTPPCHSSEPRKPSAPTGSAVPGRGSKLTAVRGDYPTRDELVRVLDERLRTGTAAREEGHDRADVAAHAEPDVQGCPPHGRRSLRLHPDGSPGTAPGPTLDLCRDDGVHYFDPWSAGIHSRFSFVRSGLSDAGRPCRRTKSSSRSRIPGDDQSPHSTASNTFSQRRLLR